MIIIIPYNICCSLQVSKILHKYFLLLEVGRESIIPVLQVRKWEVTKIK